MLATARLQTLVCVSDLPAAERFYRAGLGLPVAARRFNGLVLDVGGAPLWLCPVPDPTPSAHTIASFAVPDLAAALADLAARGIAPARLAGMPYDADGIVTAPDGTRVVWLRDPDGNILSIAQLAAGGERQ